MFFSFKKKRKKEEIKNEAPDFKEQEGIKLIPKHLAVIMDGNGRWAQEKKLPRKFGHRQGAKNLKKLCQMCGVKGISYVTVYAFSTENWSRPEDEVHALLKLFAEFFYTYKQEIIEDDIRVRFIGDLAQLPENIQDLVVTMEKDSLHCNKMQLIIALNYGGRREIIQGINKILASPDIKNITEDSFRSYLYLPDLPDPDLIIRPSGEQRLSNFLLWQAAYSEFWYSDVLWPDFSEKDLDEALYAYNRRDRRYGKIK